MKKSPRFKKNIGSYHMISYAIYLYAIVSVLFIIVKIICFAELKTQRKFDKTMLCKLGIIEASGFTFAVPVPSPE
uniref:Uncharacterized protein n=1 Tax=Rhabditophanes sp. KR3021 TaxID=114890 RepID=A0AC35THQ2_9BILA